MNNQITDIGVSTLAKHPTLQELNLGLNPIKDEGVTALAASSTLRHLNLFGNDLIKTGRFGVFNNNHTLQTLDLSGTHVNDEDGEALAKNDTLISLINTPIAVKEEMHRQIEQAVIDMLTVNRGLTSFTLTRVLIFSHEALAQVVAVLAHNMRSSPLQQLVLGREDMRDKNVFPLTADYLKHPPDSGFYQQGKQSYPQRQRHKQLFEVIRLILVYHEEARNYQLSLQQSLVENALLLQQPAEVTTNQVFFNWQALPSDLLQSVLAFSCPVPQYREDFCNQFEQWKEAWEQLLFEAQYTPSEKEGNMLFQLEQAIASESQQYQQQRRELEGSIQFIIQHRGAIRQALEKGEGIAICKKINGHTEFWLNGALLSPLKPQTLPPLPKSPCGNSLPPLPMTPQFRHLPLPPPNTVKKPEAIEVNSTKEEKQTLLPSATAPTKQQEKESRRCNIV